MNTEEEMVTVSQYLEGNHIQMKLPKEISDKVNLIMSQKKVDFWEAIKLVKKNNK
ncbi:MAG: hypothetical protein BWY27_01506 [Bacteroidetes bacterium ADurb.Bin234]|nr:MAG: hypothetical protein BWY27_01506 [Bacteroidetes bacterium ADurb.Bin234]